VVRLCIALCALVTAAAQTTYEGRPALELSSDRIKVAILLQGATIASITLPDQPSALNPLWNPSRPGAGLGHFLCLDGFGSPSPEEIKAGLPGHGEAVRQQFAADTSAANTLTLTATLPLAQEKLTRTYTVRPGEPVLYVNTRVESLAAFDRPMVWAEHATIGSPFLEAGVTAVDISGRRSQTRPYSERRQRRLASAVDFDWPNAPLAGGGTVDLRVPPSPPKSGDHTTTALDARREWAYATALHPGRKLLVAWIWRTADFPWLQNWENYGPAAMARGLEFSTQPYDIPRRDAVGMHRLFDTPTYRWLPARSTVETTFAVLYTPVPDGFVRVADVQVSGGAVVVSDGAGRSVSVKAAGLR
jgi:hypothetical protein